MVSLTHGTLAEWNEACERLVARQLHQQLVLCLTQANQLREKQLVFHGVHVDGEQARLECCTKSIAFLRQRQLQLLLQINCRRSFTEKKSPNWEIRKTSGYATWFTAGGAIRIPHYDVIDDIITQKL